MSSIDQETLAYMRPLTRKRNRTLARYLRPLRVELIKINLMIFLPLSTELLSTEHAFLELGECSVPQWIIPRRLLKPYY